MTSNSRLHVFCEPDEAVGLAGHGRDDDDDLVAALVPVRNAPGDVLDALGAADGRAAVFLDDESHWGWCGRRCAKRAQF
jgi:hypothetical protein